MCVSNRIEPIFSELFSGGPKPARFLSVILLAQVAHEQDEDDAGPGDGDGRPGDHTRHIGHAADVEEEANDDADSDRHRRQASYRVSAVSHFFHLLSK